MSKSLLLKNSSREAIEKVFRLKNELFLLHLVAACAALDCGLWPQKETTNWRRTKQSPW